MRGNVKSIRNIGKVKGERRGERLGWTRTLGQRLEERKQIRTLGLYFCIEEGTRYRLMEGSKKRDRGAVSIPALEGLEEGWEYKV